MLHHVEITYHYNQSSTQIDCQILKRERSYGQKQASYKQKGWMLNMKHIKIFEIIVK